MAVPRPQPKTGSAAPIPPLLEFETSRSPRVQGLPPLRVLLVEDDYDAARLVSRRLAWSVLANFQVAWAADVPDALWHLESTGFDAVLLDLSLPGSDGLATIAPMCALARHVPILILTGSDSDEFALTAFRSGAQDYLVKDAQDGRTLARALLAAIERQRRARAEGGDA